MESIEIYERSKKELQRIEKHSSAAVFSIDTSEMDGVTKERMLSAIRGVIAQRCLDIDRVILGVQD